LDALSLEQHIEQIDHKMFVVIARNIFLHILSRTLLLEEEQNEIQLLVLYYTTPSENLLVVVLPLARSVQ
jgi:hypothetical protein